MVYENIGLNQKNLSISGLGDVSGLRYISSGRDSIGDVTNSDVLNRSTGKLTHLRQASIEF